MSDFNIHLENTNDVFAEDFIVLMKYRNISGITAQYVSKAFEIREFLMAKHRIYL